MLKFYYSGAPNPVKVALFLEEADMPYEGIPVDTRRGDQHKPEFLRICPNNRMPAIIDHAPVGGGKPLALFESGAIVEYLADKAGKFLAAPGSAERYRVLQWVYWQMANLGPMMGNANHFKNYAKNLTSDPAQLEYGIKRFVGEVDRLCGVMDAELGAHRYLAGDEYSIADIMSWPWACLLDRLIGEGTTAQFPHLERWLAEVGARPAVQKGRNLYKEWAERPLTEEQEKTRRALLFNQTNDKVRAAREAAAKAAR